MVSVGISSLSSSLNLAGISQAKGPALLAARDQIEATLPSGQGEAKSSVKPNAKSKELSPEQQRQVQELRQIDQHVRAHEQAHISAGRGVVTSGANFSYTYGPDGKQYAVGGEVGIDTSPENKPEANIDKGQRIQIAALAPQDPSPQDHHVAAIGADLEARGYSDLQRQREMPDAPQAGAEGERATTVESAATAPKNPDESPELASRVARAYGAAEPPVATAISLFA